MKKVIVLCIVIVVSIIISDYIIKNNICSNFNYIISILERIDNENDNNIREDKVSEIEAIVRDRYLLMAFYIDHGELEKIRSQIVTIKAGIDESDESFLHEEIKKTIFIINHLKEKIDFKLENIL